MTLLVGQVEPVSEDNEVLSVTTAILDRLEHGRCKVDICAMTIEWFAAQST
jgi:hypothetical protein